MARFDKQPFEFAVERHDIDIGIFEVQLPEIFQQNAVRHIFPVIAFGEVERFERFAVIVQVRRNNFV